MLKGVGLIVLLLFLGCETPIKPSQINLLNGYWQIEYIQQEKETFRPKGAVELIDFYTLKDQKGLRKKVAPQLDQSFLTTDDQNFFEIVFENEICILKFETPWDQWQEKIVLLSENKLVLESQNKRYHYKRFHREH